MEGSGRWVIVMFGVILLVITLCYPQQVLFVLKFIWDLMVLNLQPLLDSLHKVVSPK